MGPTVNSTANGSADPYPYVGGYMTGSLVTGGVVVVTTSVNFGGTPQSAVPSGNRIMAGIVDTVFSNITGLDYSYAAMAVIQGSGPMYLIAQVGEYCEGFIITACGVTPWSELLYLVTPSPPMTSSDTIQLYMEFSSSTAYWVYKINGGAANIFGEFTPPSDSQHVFNVGTYYVSDLGRLAKYFQFGIESISIINNHNWYVNIDNPQYAKAWGQPYTLVPQADAVQGENAWLDGEWLVGGSQYTGVNACYADNTGCPYPGYEILFRYTGTTIQTLTRLWG